MSENEFLSMRVLLVTGLQIAALQSRILHLQTVYTHTTQLLADARDERTNFEMAEAEDGAFFAGDLDANGAADYKNFTDAITGYEDYLHSVLVDSASLTSEIASLSARAVAAAHAIDDKAA